MKKIGVVGSRRRNEERDFFLVRGRIYLHMRPGDSLVSGGCKEGADHFAEAVYEQFKAYFPLGQMIIHLPDKTKLDKRLPYRAAYAKIAYARNELIARDSNILIACVAPDRTGGTENTIKHFLRINGLTEEEALMQGRLILV